MCCRHFIPPFLHLLSFPFLIYFLKTTNISCLSHFLTALALFVWECAPKCVPSSSLFLPLLLLLLLLLSSTRPPPHTHPPIIEADSASRACTRHTRWLQHLECSLGHYSTPHYRKRSRGGDKEEEQQLREKTDLRGNICTSFTFRWSLTLMGLDVSSPVPSLSLLWMQWLDAWLWRRGSGTCCSAAAPAAAALALALGQSRTTLPWASHTLVTFDW